MTGTTDHGDRRPLDPDATVVLPVGLPSAGPAATGPTVAAPGALTPTAGSADEAPTMAFDSSPTVVLSPVPGGPDLDSIGAVALDSTSGEPTARRFRAIPAPHFSSSSASS